VNHGFTPSDVANLAFVCFGYCSRSTKTAALEELLAAGLREIASPVAIFLQLSFELDLDGMESDRPVRERYLDTLLRPNVLTAPERPIVFWHVPKCSGTSLNAAIGSHVYAKPINEVLPGYNFRPLVKFLARELLQEIPYFPSMHFGMDELVISTPHVGYTVIRDPILRCLSMYRQEMAANLKNTSRHASWYHYRVIPRYGTFWDYRNDTTFAKWIDNIPETLLLRQLTTFSDCRDVQRAAQRVNSLDFVLGRDDIQAGSELELFEVLGFNYKEGTVPTDLNRTDKSIVISDKAIGSLKPRLRAEYEMIEQLSSGSD